MSRPEDSLKQRIQTSMKTAMKAGDKPRLSVIRLMLAAIKQQEVDQRVSLDDSLIIAVLDKMVKQRRESVKQYRDAGREDLATAEEAEITVIKEFLPTPLDPSTIREMIETAVAHTSASSIRDMGRVMAELKRQMQGRADMAAVSAQVRERLDRT